MAHRRNKILYFAPCRTQHVAFIDQLRGVADLVVDDSAEPPKVCYRNVDVCWTLATDADQVLTTLHDAYVNVLLLDLRASTALAFEQCRRAGIELLRKLDDVPDVESRYGFHRIMVLVSGPAAERVDALLVELGARGVRTVLRQRGDGVEESRQVALRAVETAIEMVRQRRHGKRALCAAGGGITGIYFEMGVLKCLDDCLPEGALNTFDMYFGISAGAVVCSFLANGYSPDELMASIAGVPGGRVQPIDFRLLRLAHVNFRGVANHVRRGLRGTGRQLFESLRRLELPSLTSLFLELTDAMPPPFHSDDFERLLREILEAPGVTNDFRKLPRSLYVGATDQDARQHVLFGDERHLDVPISRAVQASSAINPAFRSVEINGRRFEDGAVTRTANFHEAIRRDASLVFVIDPFLPYVSKHAGMAHDRGLLYNIDQNIRTVSYTRFENARNWILRQHPEVSSYTFLPSNTLRRLLSLSPMDHRPYLEIWRGAYLSTLKRIQHLRHRMRGDLAAHGIELDPSRAESVAVRLRASTQLRFRDFFPSGRVELSLPPLSEPEPLIEPALELRTAV